MRVAFVVALSSLLGCATPPPEAPTELAELANFLFRHADDEDPTELAAGIATLRELTADEDVERSPRDRAVVLDVLDGDDLDGLPIPAGAEASDQVARGLTRRSEGTFDDKRQLVLEPNRVCIEGDITVWARRTFTEGAGCFG
ncbi:MAG: hypothetical protein AAF211_25715, partial [Myxococcota bacterium]